MSLRAGRRRSGGDFLDAFAVPGGTVALVVGDASGHGLEAAVHNAHVKDVLRAFLREHPRDPGSTVARLNEVVCDTLQADEASWDRFIVLSLVVLDPLTGEAYFTSAGAEPPLVLRASGGVEVVRPMAWRWASKWRRSTSRVPLRLEPGEYGRCGHRRPHRGALRPRFARHRGRRAPRGRVARPGLPSRRRAGDHGGADAFGRDALSDNLLILARR